MSVLQTVLDHLHAGRWTDAHNLVQSDATELGAWLHGIVHIVEGDLEDAEYWYTQANRHFRSRGTLHEELESFARELANAPEISQKNTHGETPQGQRLTSSGSGRRPRAGSRRPPPMR